MPTLKRAEFVVTAESDWGIERGVAFALQNLERVPNVDGEHFIERHNIHVKWRIVSFNEGSDPTVGSILSDSTPTPPPAPMPDISGMDIEEANGVVGVASGLAELQALEDIEVNSVRYPGGRKGVLKFINQRRKEINDLAAAKAEEAEKAKEA